jgi:hypothetical protein
VTTDAGFDQSPDSRLVRPWNDDDRRCIAAYSVYLESKISSPQPTKAIQSLESVTTLVGKIRVPTINKVDQGGTDLGTMEAIIESRERHLAVAAAAVGFYCHESINTRAH